MICVACAARSPHLSSTCCDDAREKALSGRLDVVDVFINHALLSKSLEMIFVILRALALTFENVFMPMLLILPYS